MARSKQDEVFDRIRSGVFEGLTPQQRQTTNLYLDERIREKGEQLGPEFQKIVADRPCVLVFADDAALANFGHDCRYLLHDPETGKLLREIPARFPPYLKKPPETLR